MAELEDAIESVSERVNRVESILSENEIDRNKMKILLDEILKRLDKGDDRFAVGKESIEALQSKVDVLSRNDAEGLTALEKVQREIGEIKDRFAGRTLLGMSEQPSYEAAVSMIFSLRDRLSGGEGRFSWEGVRERTQQSSFLTRLMVSALSLFGVGTVGTVVFTMFGGEDISPAVLELRQKVDFHDQAIKKIELKIDSNSDIARRLERIEDSLVKP